MKPLSTECQKGLPHVNKQTNNKQGPHGYLNNNQIIKQQDLLPNVMFGRLKME